MAKKTLFDTAITTDFAVNHVCQIEHDDQGNVIFTDNDALIKRSLREDFDRILIVDHKVYDIATEEHPDPMIRTLVKVTKRGIKTTDGSTALNDAIIRRLMRHIGSVTIKDHLVVMEKGVK